MQCDSKEPLARAACLPPRSANCCRIRFEAAGFHTAVFGKVRALIRSSARAIFDEMEDPSVSSEQDEAVAKRSYNCCRLTRFARVHPSRDRGETSLVTLWQGSRYAVLAPRSSRSRMAASLRRGAMQPTGWWHLDEIVVRIGGKRMFLWWAVDDEGEVLDMLVQKRRNKAAALRLLRRLLKNQGVQPERLVTDCLASYGAAVRDLNLKDRHRSAGMRANNRAENSHLSIRRRERMQQRFKSQGSAQRLLSTYAVIHNPFNLQQYLTSRPRSGSSGSVRSMRRRQQPLRPSDRGTGQITG